MAAEGAKRWTVREAFFQYTGLLSVGHYKFLPTSGYREDNSQLMRNWTACPVMHDLQCAQVGQPVMGWPPSLTRPPRKPKEDEDLILMEASKEKIWEKQQQRKGRHQ
jgi:hypothetical protein